MLKEPTVEELIASGRLRNYVNEMMKIEMSNYFFTREEPMPLETKEIMAEHHTICFCYLMTEEERIRAERELRLR